MEGIMRVFVQADGEDPEATPGATIEEARDGGGYMVTDKVSARTERAANVAEALVRAWDLATGDQIDAAEVERAEGRTVEMRGSQRREGFHEAGYTLRAYDGDRAILADADGQLEVWAASDDYAGYVVEIGGIGHEFVRQLMSSELETFLSEQAEALAAEVTRLRDQTQGATPRGVELAEATLILRNVTRKLAELPDESARYPGDNREGK
jgi:hypothetical protein